MDKREARRLALKRLADSLGRGGITRIAEATGIDASYVSRMLYPPGKDGRKGIGEDSADLISAAFPGWLDGIHTGATDARAAVEQTDRVISEPQRHHRTVALAPPSVTLDLDADCLVVWRQLMQLPERDREEWRAKLDIAAATARLDKLGSTSSLPPKTADPPHTNPKYKRARSAG